MACKRAKSVFVSFVQCSLSPCRSVYIRHNMFSISSRLLHDIFNIFSHSPSYSFKHKCQPDIHFIYNCQYSSSSSFQHLKPGTVYCVHPILYSSSSLIFFSSLSGQFANLRNNQNWDPGWFLRLPSSFFHYYAV